MKDLTMRRKIRRWKWDGLSYNNIGRLIVKNRGGRIGCKPGKHKVVHIPELEELPSPEIKLGFFTRIINRIKGVLKWLLKNVQ